MKTARNSTAKGKKKIKAIASMIASAYTKSQLEGMADAIDTAIEDSEDWEKYSDEGDDRRSVEQRHLGMLSEIVCKALIEKIGKSDS